jgi:hypothetical protein
MSQCGVNRWGPGTTKERVADTENSKELKDKMALMIKEREKQNSMWIQVSDTAKPSDMAKPSDTAKPNPTPR